MKMRIVLISGLIMGGLLYYLLEWFGINSIYTPFLENLYDYNQFIGLAFSILSCTVLLFGLYKFYKFVKIKSDIE